MVFSNQHFKCCSLNLEVNLKQKYMLSDTLQTGWDS